MFLENGMPRYFKRLSEGIYDEEDLMFRGQELAAFIQEVAKEKRFLNRTSCLGWLL